MQVKQPPDTILFLAQQHLWTINNQGIPEALSQTLQEIQQQANSVMNPIIDKGPSKNNRLTTKTIVNQHREEG